MTRPITDPVMNRVRSLNQPLWALEWSQRQNTFHVQPLHDALSANRSAYTGNAKGDYRILHIGYRDEVDAMADACRGTLQRRAGASGLADVLGKAI